jgi:hypothetical protein
MPDRAVIRTALGVSPPLAATRRGKALFRIGISDDRTYDGLMTTEVLVESSQAWQPISIDLSKYGGFKWSLFYRPREKIWNVIFNTTIKGLGRPITPADRVFWGHPTIEGAP